MWPSQNILTWSTNAVNISDWKYFINKSSKFEIHSSILDALAKEMNYTLSREDVLMWPHLPTNWPFFHFYLWSHPLSRRQGIILCPINFIVTNGFKTFMKSLSNIVCLFDLGFRLFGHLAYLYWVSSSNPQQSNIHSCKNYHIELRLALIKGPLSNSLIPFSPIESTL